MGRREADAPPPAYLARCASWRIDIAPVELATEFSHGLLEFRNRGRPENPAPDRASHRRFRLWHFGQPRVRVDLVQWHSDTDFRQIQPGVIP